jgi:hypothetical protein
LCVRFFSTTHHCFHSNHQIFTDPESRVIALTAEGNVAEAAALALSLPLEVDQLKRNCHTFALCQLAAIDAILSEKAVEATTWLQKGKELTEKLAQASNGHDYAMFYSYMRGRRTVSVEVLAEHKIKGKPVAELLATTSRKQDAWALNPYVRKWRSFVHTGWAAC